jgi:hypothetical protein
MPGFLRIELREVAAAVWQWVARDAFGEECARGHAATYSKAYAEAVMQCRLYWPDAQIEVR